MLEYLIAHTDKILGAIGGICVAASTYLIGHKKQRKESEKNLFNEAVSIITQLKSDIKDLREENRALRQELASARAEFSVLNKRLLELERTYCATRN